MHSANLCLQKTRQVLSSSVFWSDVIEIFYILSTPGGTETFREIKISIFTDSEIKVPNCHWSDIIKGSSFLPLVCIVSLHVV